MRQSLPSFVDTEAMQITSASDTCQVMYKHKWDYIFKYIYATQKMSAFVNIFRMMLII